MWRTSWRDEETLLVNNRQMMCVYELVVCKERIMVMTRNSLLLFVDKTESSNEESEYPFQCSINECSG